MVEKTKRAATDKGWDGLLNYQRSIFWRFGQNAEKEQHAWVSTKKLYDVMAVPALQPPVLVASLFEF